MIDEGCALHWLPPTAEHPESQCYMVLPNGLRVDFLIHQKVPYLAGEELTELSMALIKDERLATEFFEDLLQQPEEKLREAGLLFARDEAQKCEEDLKVNEEGAEGVEPAANATNVEMSDAERHPRRRQRKDEI